MNQVLLPPGKWEEIIKAVIAYSNDEISKEESGGWEISLAMPL